MSADFVCVRDNRRIGDKFLENYTNYRTNEASDVDIKRHTLDSSRPWLANQEREGGREGVTYGT